MAALLASAALVACGGGAGAPATTTGSVPDRFDARRAFADLRAQVALGPRPAGSEASRRLAERLRARLPGGRFESVPGGLRNVVGRLPGRGRPILVGAHYDTKDIPGFVAPTTGPSGMATVLELARVLRAGRRACEREIRFVMFDGEESPRGSRRDFLRDGAARQPAYAAAHARELAAGRGRDFVGDKDLSIPREAGSDARLWRLLRARRRRVGAIGVFPGARHPGPHPRRPHAVHRPAGVPAIDLIDFDYPYFHRPSDTLDKVSARSLDRVGETLVDMLRRVAAQTCPEG